MKTLVTGATGFLGRYVVEQLRERDVPVRALVRKLDDELAALDVEQVVGDIRDRAIVVEACRGVDTVHHVAGVAGIWGSWRHYYEINTLGSEYVLEGCRRHGVARLVYTSSPSVTFDGGPQEGIDEAAPYPRRWLCHYPHTKALAEQRILAANGSDRLATCSLRPHLIWGPRDRHLLPRLIARAHAGQLRRVGDGTNRIDTIYVENAAHAHLLAADALATDSPVAGRAYFISQGEPVNCWQWIDQLLELAGLPPVEKSVSLRTAWTAGRVLEIVHRLLGSTREPRMTRFLAAQLGNSHFFDITAARRDFGFTPQIPTEEGLRRLATELRAAR
ncbi:MAG: NAD-dependent epimerase/dehydratase family protein [Planctomycetota bacterium]|nr:MAG: NAD-dependent epimerase/dehydratase family protein [Planctomycetota bacterium]REJ98568.1 MAG: NAD-dependent epimerase/dehydratase family protein [Planctomycetota bacterium]